MSNDEEKREILIENMARYGVSLKKHIIQILTHKKEQNISPEPRRSPRLSEGVTNVSGNETKHNLCILCYSFMIIVVHFVTYS